MHRMAMIQRAISSDACAFSDERCEGRLEKSGRWTKVTLTQDKQQ